MTISETIYGVFFDPVNTLRGLSREKSVMRGLLLFSLASLITVFINQAVTYTQGISLFSGKAMALTAMLGFVISLVSLFLMVGLYSLLGELLYKKTNSLSLLGCMSYASLPGALGTAVGFAFVLLGLESVGLLFTFLGSMWVMVLSVLSLREALELDTSQSILLFFLPPVVLVVLLLASLVGLLIVLA